MLKFKYVIFSKFLCGAFFACCASTFADRSLQIEALEPNAEMACRWWPEFENVWTPIGWKDHFLRFNVLYNGIVVAEPHKKPFIDQGVQLTFIPAADGTVADAGLHEKPYRLAEKDGGVGNQGWRNDMVPVLWTQWRQDGLVLHEEIFAHVPNTQPVKTGIEPLYAWIRLSVHCADATTNRDKYGWLVKINKPHIRRSMWRQKNLVANPGASVYPRRLSAELLEDISKAGCRLVEPDGKVRLGIAPGAEYSVRFIDRDAGKKDVILHIEMPAQKGAHVDLLVPIVPAERAVFDAELASGFDKALAESEEFWSQIPETAAQVVTPEKAINEAIKHALKFAEVIAIRHPATGQYSLLSGSWNYEALWATPTSMTCTMVLDTMGYHSTAEKYLEVLKEEQGKCVPPGDAYKLHPGYLSTPKILTAIDWLSDHGAILHAICHHALLTEDRRFIDRYIDTIVKACEFIKDSRRVTGHGGVEGILPPAVATDRKLRIQAVWNDGWNYKGLATAARLLRRLDHPRAEEFNQEALAYRESFTKAIIEAARRTPQWTDSKGRAHHFIPTALPDGGDTVHPFYLDTGPLFLVYAGLMKADDDLMQSALSYFRDGPNIKTYNINGEWDQPVCLHHEISSSEPCYSWNIFHSHQLGDRYRFLEGMYSMILGALSRQTYIGCEHRGGISGTLFSAPLGIYAVRLSVIDDQVQPGELHLLRLVPLSWLSREMQTMFDNIPTEYGPLTLRFGLGLQSQKLNVALKTAFRRPPDKLFLHVPPLKSLQEVEVNGRVFPVKPGAVLQIR